MHFFQVYEHNPLVCVHLFFYATTHFLLPNHSLSYEQTLLHSYVQPRLIVFI